MSKSTEEEEHRASRQYAIATKGKTMTGCSRPPDLRLVVEQRNNLSVVFSVAGIMEWAHTGSQPSWARRNRTGEDKRRVQASGNSMEEYLACPFQLRGENQG